MIRYGALLPADGRGEIRFFRTSGERRDGTYQTSDFPGARVVIAGSTAALLMAIYPSIRQMQDQGQKDLSSGTIGKDASERLAERMTDNLSRRLAEDDDIWEDEPSWLKQAVRMKEPGPPEDLK